MVYDKHVIIQAKINENEIYVDNCGRYIMKSRRITLLAMMDSIYLEPLVSLIEKSTHKLDPSINIYVNKTPSRRYTMSNPINRQTVPNDPHNMLHHYCGPWQ